MTVDAPHLSDPDTARLDGIADTIAGDLRILPYSSERKQEIVDLLNVCLGQKLTGARTVDYWTWKHERNPFGRSILLLAECHGRLVGVRAFMRWRLVCGGQTFEVGKPVDSVTHPDFQRRGIFSQLTTAACEHARELGIALLFNTPNRNSLPGYLKLGWREVGRLRLRVKLLRPVSAAARAAKWKWARGEAPEHADFFREPPCPAASVIADDKRLIDLLESARGGEKLCTVRDVSFLRWRYCEHPHIPYFVETTESNGKLEGVLFGRTNWRYGMREVLIDDILVRRGDPNAVGRLVRSLLNRVRADYMLAHVPDDSLTLPALRKLGFRRAFGRRITLVARPLMDGLRPDPTIVRNWSLCLGDIEGL